MLQIVPVDARDDGRFTVWYSALRAGATAGRHAPIVVSATAMRSQLLHQTRAVRHAVGAFDGDQCLGTAVLERDTQDNTHLGELDVNVPPEYRRQGIGTLLLQQLLGIAAGVGLTTLLGEVNVVDETSPGLAFTVRHGFHSVHTENRLVLDLPAVTRAD
ncbi:GNAT family N-acetyltransferase [uncultured Friedmanniella sp.]|uniref:GNAT family N-acetyltransferase n=1 Tax=uncultured Friedmanniella sp. TaxID=335381 RepID=UPI0035CCA1DF